MSARLAHGCSAYSRSNAASAVSIRAAWSTSQPPLASTRTLPPGPIAVTDRLDPGDVVGCRLARLGDLDLRGPAARPGDDRVRLLGADGGDGYVHRDGVAHGRRPAVNGRLQRAREPARALARTVLGERRELSPPRRAVQQRTLPQRGAAELHRHRDRERPQRGQQVGDELGGRRRPADRRRAGRRPADRRRAGRARSGYSVTGHAVTGHGRRGNLAKSGARLPTYASRPSCASSLM